MTIGLILQRGLSESSRSPVSVLQVEEHNANSRVASLKQIVISACTAIFAKLELDPGVEKKNCFWRGKTHRISPKKFLRPRDTYKKYILQKNWVKTVIPAFSSGQSNLPPSIWGPSRQLDDQHRNTNMNNKDHLVGQLTNINNVDSPYLIHVKFHNDKARRLSVARHFVLKHQSTKFLCPVHILLTDLRYTTWDLWMRFHIHYITANVC